MTATHTELSDEVIARRAYEIFESGASGTDVENWFRAEEELRGMMSVAPPKRRRAAAKPADGEKPSRARKTKASAEKPGASGE